MIKLGDKKIYERNKNFAFDEIISLHLIKRVINNLGQKATNWSNKNIDYRAVVSERIVEYPLVFQQFAKMGKKVQTILDFGCVEDLLPIHLASLGYKVTGLDLRQYPFTHPNFEFVRADILS